MNEYLKIRKGILNIYLTTDGDEVAEFVIEYLKKLNIKQLETLYYTEIPPSRQLYPFIKHPNIPSIYPFIRFLIRELKIKDIFE